MPDLYFWKLQAPLAWLANETKASVTKRWRRGWNCDVNVTCEMYLCMGVGDRADLLSFAVHG